MMLPGWRAALGGCVSCNLHCGRSCSPALRRLSSRVELPELEAVIATGDIRLLSKELEGVKHGFSIQKLAGNNMLLASNSKRYPLHAKAKKWDHVHDGRRLLKFVMENRDPGKVRCARCNTWFDSYTLQQFQYTHGNCLGYCNAARRHGSAC